MSDIRAGAGLAGERAHAARSGPGPATTCATTRPAVTRARAPEPQPVHGRQAPRQLDREASVVEAPAQNLPVPGRPLRHRGLQPSSTARCPTSRRPLAEIARRAQAGRHGSCFVEHVRSADPKLARRPGRSCGPGARSAPASLQPRHARHAGGVPLAVEQVEHGKLPHGALAGRAADHRVGPAPPDEYDTCHGRLRRPLRRSGRAAAAHGRVRRADAGPAEAGVGRQRDQARGRPDRRGDQPRRTSRATSSSRPSRSAR